MGSIKSRLCRDQVTHGEYRRWKSKFSKMLCAEICHQGCVSRHRKYSETEFREKKNSIFIVYTPRGWHVWGWGGFRWIPFPKETYRESQISESQIGCCCPTCKNHWRRPFFIEVSSKEWCSLHIENHSARTAHRVTVLRGVTWQGFPSFSRKRRLLLRRHHSSD